MRITILSATLLIASCMHAMYNNSQQNILDETFSFNQETVRQQLLHAHQNKSTYTVGKDYIQCEGFINEVVEENGKLSEKLNGNISGRGILNARDNAIQETKTQLLHRGTPKSAPSEIRENKNLLLYCILPQETAKKLISAEQSTSK